MIELKWPETAGGCGTTMPEERTPFAQLLLDYMWAQRPPLNISGLARLTGLSKATVSNWVGGKTVPQPGTLTLLSNKTGIPLSAMYEALGTSYTTTESSNVLDYIYERARTSERLSPVQREQLMLIVRELQAEYPTRSESGPTASSSSTAPAARNDAPDAPDAPEREAGRGTSKYTTPQIAG